jgi:diguanylate cyclase (GGDEF)-like protein
VTTDAMETPGRRPHWHVEHLNRLLAGLAFVGGSLGSLNLVVGDVLRPGSARVVYACLMAVCFLLSGVLWRWPAVVDRGRLPLVLLADAMYLVITTTIVDASTYATPLMLLFATILAAWVLGPRTLPVHLVVVYLVCWVALAPAISDPRLLAVQVAVQGSVLNSAAVVVLLLRRRSAQLLQQMHELSVTDALTGLPNRRALAERAPDLWQAASRERRMVAALAIDLDHFKIVNDAHGHAAGDELLRRVADALRTAVRTDDLVARTGGEEFVVLTLVESGEPVVLLADRLRNAITEVDHQHRPTASIGIALAQASTLDQLGAAGGVVAVDAVDAVDATWRLLDRADGALYEAKRQGRDRWVLASAASPPVPRVRDHDRVTLSRSTVNRPS